MGVIALFVADDVRGTEQFVRDRKKIAGLQLIEAASKGIIADANDALRMSADINFQDEDGGTALTFAALKGDEAMAQFLLGRANIDVNLSVTHEANRRCTPLTVAILKGNSNVAKLLLARDIAKIDTIAGYGMTPFLLAVRNGKVDIVKWLVDEGADIYLKVGKNKLTWRNVLKQAKTDENVDSAKLSEISQYLIEKEEKEEKEEYEKLDQLIKLINDMLNENTNNEHRQAAITRLKEQANQMNSENVLNFFERSKKLKQEYENFKFFDTTTQKLALVGKKYTGTNNYRRASITNIETAINSAYFTYANDSQTDANSVREYLLENVNDIKKLAHNDHKSHGALRFFGIFQPSSKVVTIIDETLQDLKSTAIPKV